MSKIWGNIVSEKVHWVAEASAATLGSKSGAAAVGGGVSSFAAFIAGINWIGWLSFAIAVLGLLINFYFSYQRDRRERQIHQAQMRQIEGECNEQ